MTEDLSRIIKIKDKPLLSRDDIFLFSIIFGFILGALLFTFYTPNYYEDDLPIQLEIKRGMTLDDVIDTLSSENIIPGKSPLRFAAFLYGAENKIKAGTYVIPNGLTYFELMELLLDGAPMPQTKVTIHEGIWQHRMAGIFANSLALDSTKFMKLSNDKAFITSLNLKVKSLEGYLLPETYYFFPISTEQDVIKRMKIEMDKLFDKDANEQMKKFKMTKHKILTLASIIEAESNKISEFKTISGVYHNRLKKGYRLEADPTLQYLKRFRKHNKIYYKDKDIDSPYNTYKYYGLPPGPINNPGKDAVIAALYPEKHNYLYFVADGNGGHRFATNLADHNKNVSDYRNWRRQSR
jgi:UPF0755 protein